MVLIVCLDTRNGMRFNNRRQSADQHVISRILELFPGEKITVRPYSAKLFPESAVEIVERPDESTVFFLEERSFVPEPKSVERIIVFRWDKAYPADERFPIQDFSAFLTSKTVAQFSGKSHDIITQEEYGL